MNNSICVVCECEFEMGVNGVFIDESEMCDACAGQVRTPSGECYAANAPYETRRPITSAFLNARGARPGDYAVVHPKRKLAR